jgi:hypothetical protein
LSGESKQSRLPTELLVKMAAAATGVGVGTQLGPTAGAFASAGMEPLFAVVAGYARRADASAALFASRAAEHAGMSAEELAAWAETPERLEVLAAALSAAWSTLDLRRVEALAVVMSEALLDDAKLDLAPLLISALAELGPAHIRVLTLLDEGENVGEPEAQGHGQMGGDEWATDHLSRELPMLEDGMDHLLAQLNRVGCITIGKNRLDGGSWWTVTPFGNTCLWYLREGVAVEKRNPGGKWGNE